MTLYEIMFSVIILYIATYGVVHQFSLLWPVILYLYLVSLVSLLLIMCHLPNMELYKLTHIVNNVVNDMESPNKVGK